MRSTKTRWSCNCFEQTQLITLLRITYKTNQMCKHEKYHQIAHTWTSNCANLKTDPDQIAQTWKRSRSNRANLKTIPTCLSVYLRPTRCKPIDRFTACNIQIHTPPTLNISEIRDDETIAADIYANLKNISDQIAQTWKRLTSACAESVRLVLWSMPMRSDTNGAPNEHFAGDCHECVRLLSI